MSGPRHLLRSYRSTIVLSNGIDSRGSHIYMNDLQSGGPDP